MWEDENLDLHENAEHMDLPAMRKRYIAWLKGRAALDPSDCAYELDQELSTSTHGPEEEASEDALEEVIVD